MKKWRCDNDTCGRPFGLTRHRWLTYQFCCAACKQDFIAKRADEIERVKRWITQLGQMRS